MTPPTVSVVIPALNEEARIGHCVRALKAQDYPQDLLEIIVADNGSTDRTVEVAKAAGARVVHEAQRNADAARNTAARVARGDVLAFTDADCEPSKHWLSRAVPVLASADLVAGHIQFTFGEGKARGWQLYDALFNLQHGQSVSQRKVAFTANLLVWRGVFGKVGGFAEDCHGGGDLHFTKSATSKGYHLGFAQGAVVRHPARDGRELMRKAWRIGLEKGASTKKDVVAGTRLHRGAALKKPHLIGMLPQAVWRRARRQGLRLNLIQYFSVLFCNVAYLAVGAAGLATGLRKRRAIGQATASQSVDSMTTTP